MCHLCVTVECKHLLRTFKKAQIPKNNSADMSLVSLVVAAAAPSLLALAFPPTFHIHANQVDWRLRIAARYECESEWMSAC